MFGGIGNIFKGVSGLFGGAAGGAGGIGGIFGSVLGGVLGGGGKSQANPLQSMFGAVTELFNKGPIQEGAEQTQGWQPNAEAQSQNPLMAVVDKLIGLVTSLVSSLMGALGMGGGAGQGQNQLPGGGQGQILPVRPNPFADAQGVNAKDTPF
ncbi:MAG: hypothetical protein ACOYN0_18495 [Phycisphaerales bacterium]